MLLSIVMAVYNEEKYIKYAIESILSQSYKNIELIVVNDGSTDSTEQIVNNMLENDSRLKFISLDKVGKNAAFNKGVEVSAGEWIGLFAGDDVMEPGILQKLVSVASVYSPQKQKVLIGALQRMFTEDEKFKFEHNIVVSVKNNNGIFANTVGIISSALCFTVFPIPTSYPNEDTWLALAYRYMSEIRIQTNFVYTNYRIHSNNSYDHAASDFTVYNQAYHKRRIAIKEFCHKHGDSLSIEQKSILLQLYKLEMLRYDGRIFKIFLVKNVPIKEKIKAFFFSNSLLNSIKLKLSRFVLGRI